jgi:hypothetical protein
MLSSHYKELYENYYTDAPDKKRRLARSIIFGHWWGTKSLIRLSMSEPVRRR